jgi:hypothetical protein
MSYKQNPGYISATIDTQKSIARRVILKLEAFGFTDSVCAGGAPRDWYLGIPAKDLDFFVDDTKSVVGFLKSIGVEDAEPLERSGMYESNPRLNCVYEFVYEKQKCQIIVVQDTGDKLKAKDIYTTFPVNVSKARYYKDKADWVLGYTSDFTYGHQFKILDFKEELLYNNYYKRKIRSRFKDYGLVLRKKKPEEVKFTLDDLVDATACTLDLTAYPKG